MARDFGNCLLARRIPTRKNTVKPARGGCPRESTRPVRRLFLIHLICWIALPAAFFAFLIIAYREAIAAGRLPFQAPSEWKWWAGFLVTLTAGASGIASAHISQPVARILLPLLYLFIMAVCLIVLGLGVGCRLGDCI